MNTHEKLEQYRRAIPGIEDITRHAQGTLYQLIRVIEDLIWLSGQRRLQHSAKTACHVHPSGTIEGNFLGLVHIAMTCRANPDYLKDLRNTTHTRCEIRVTLPTGENKNLWELGQARFLTELLGPNEHAAHFWLLKTAKQWPQRAGEIRDLVTKPCPILGIFDDLDPVPIFVQILSGYLDHLIFTDDGRAALQNTALDETAQEKLVVLNTKTTSHDQAPA